VDPDAVWDGEWGRLRVGCITSGGDCQRGRDSFGGEPLGTLLHICCINA